MDIRRLRTYAGLFMVGVAAWCITSPASTAAALDFSADRIVKRDKSVVKSHVNAKHDRWRFEFVIPQRGASVVIVRADRGTAWLILSKRRQYVEEPIWGDHRLTVTESMTGEVSRELVGDEVLDGRPVELFEVTVAEDGETRQYYRWVTKVERFPLKTVSKQGTWSEEFHRVVFTEQSPFLFELPRRLDPANPPASEQ